MPNDPRSEPHLSTAQDHVHSATRDTKLVYEAFGIDLDAALDLPTFEGSGEARPAARPSRRGSYLPRREVDAKLEKHADHVSAGATDAMLAERTGLRPGQVRRWRRRHGLASKSGGRSADVSVRVRAAAPQPTPHALVAMHKTVSEGQLRPPAYVLRKPLIYDRFAELVGVLVEADYRPSFIASAFGLHERDVEVGSAFAERYLK